MIEITNWEGGGVRVNLFNFEREKKERCDIDSGMGCRFMVAILLSPFSLSFLSTINYCFELIIVCRFLL